MVSYNLIEIVKENETKIPLESRVNLDRIHSQCSQSCNKLQWCHAPISMIKKFEVD